MSNQEKVVRDNKVAVLVAPGFGAGWASWASREHREWAIFAPEVVAWVETGKPGGEKAIEQMAKAKWGEESHFCCLGAMQLEIHWLDIGTQFDIDEYDGSESLRFADQEWWIA